MPPKKSSYKNGAKKSTTTKVTKIGSKDFSTAFIPQTPTFMRLGSRKKAFMTLCTPAVCGKQRTLGYALDPHSELDRLIDQASDADFRIGSINFGLPPVAHIFILMKLDTELRVYDVQHKYAEMYKDEGITTWYEDFTNQFCDCTGYRYFVDGLLARMRREAPDKNIQLRLMPSPEINQEIWDVIDYGAEGKGRPSPTEVRGPCMLWADAVLNRHWKVLLEEAYAN